MDSITMRGHVDTFLVSPDGERRHVQEGCNTVSYACADAAARLFAGRGGGPRTVGFVYGTANDLASGFQFADGDRDRTEADIVDTGVLSVANVPVDPNPGVSASDGNYGGNVVTFRATTVDNTAKWFVYGYLLKDADGNVLAVRKLPSVVTKSAGYALAVSWAIKFL